MTSLKYIQPWIKDYIVEKCVDPVMKKICYQLTNFQELDTVVLSSYLHRKGEKTLKRVSKEVDELDLRPTKRLRLECDSAPETFPDHVPSRKARNTFQSENISQPDFASFDEEHRKKKKKKKKKASEEIDSEAFEPISSSNEAFISETPVERQPDKPSPLTQIFSKLLVHLENLSENHKRNVEGEIYRAINTHICSANDIENEKPKKKKKRHKEEIIDLVCDTEPETIISEEHIDVGADEMDVSSNVSKKKHRKNDESDQIAKFESRYSPEIYVDADDTDASSHVSKKKKKKHREKSDYLDLSPEISVDIGAEETDASSYISKKKKKRHRENEESNQPTEFRCLSPEISSQNQQPCQLNTSYNYTYVPQTDEFLHNKLLSESDTDSETDSIVCVCHKVDLTVTTVKTEQMTDLENEPEHSAHIEKPLKKGKNNLFHKKDQSSEPIDSSDRQPEAFDQSQRNETAHIEKPSKKGKTSLSHKKDQRIEPIDSSDRQQEAPDQSLLNETEAFADDAELPTKKIRKKNISSTKDTRMNESNSGDTQPIILDNNPLGEGPSNAGVVNSDLLANINVDSIQSDDPRTLEKELLELEQVLLTADKSTAPKESIQPMKTVVVTIPMKKTEVILGSCPDAKPRTNSSRRNFSCYKCEAKFTERHAFIEHWFQHVEEVLKRLGKSVPSRICNFECKRCKIKFDKLSKLKMHLLGGCFESNSGESLRCYVCSKRFSCQEEFEKHRVSHLKQHPCTLCDYRCNRKSDLKRHMWVHSDLRPFKCRQCDASFKTKSELKKHRIVHSSDRPYICSRCNAAFRRKGDLEIHWVTHTGIRRYACSDCGDGFIKRSHLENHVLSKHSSLKPHECEQCQVSFKLKHNLKKHMLIHLDDKDKPYQCHLCNYSACFNNNFKIHLRRKHSVF